MGSSESAVAIPRPACGNARHRPTDDRPWPPTPSVEEAPTGAFTRAWAYAQLAKMQDHSAAPALGTQTPGLLIGAYELTLPPHAGRCHVLLAG